MKKMAAIAGTIRTTVLPRSRASVDGETPSKRPLMIAARKTAVPVEETGTMSMGAFSQISRLGPRVPGDGLPLGDRLDACRPSPAATTCARPSTP